MVSKKKEPDASGSFRCSPKTSTAILNYNILLLHKIFNTFMIDYAGYIKLDLGICTIIKGPKFSESQCFKYSPNRNCHVVVKKMCYNASFVVIPNKGSIYFSFQVHALSVFRFIWIASGSMIPI